jgi:hypothetical protein
MRCNRRNKSCTWQIRCKWSFDECVVHKAAKSPNVEESSIVRGIGTS